MSPRNQTIDHYDVEVTLGRGAMGAVYLAKDQRIGRRVALKTIAIPPEQLDDSTFSRDFHVRLQREAELSGSLSHPNIVALYEAGYENQKISYLAMEYVEGRSLLDLMKARLPSPLDVPMALRIIGDVLNGLAHAHAAGIIHRDIKPANVLITRDGVSKIADFGLARPTSSSLTAAGTLMGTPNYMSPEQILGQPITAKADVFSAGVMLFEMLTATKPFAASDITGTLHRILRSEVPNAADLNGKVSRYIGDVILRMVAKDPAKRPTAEEAIAMLRGLESPAVATPKKRKALPLIAAAIIAAIIFSIVAFAATRRAARPTVEIAPAKLAEFEDKRRELDRAEEALRSGRYQESLERFNAYLAKYPDSSIAVAGRDLSRDALAKQAAPQAAQKAAKKPRPKDDEDISPSELFSRIKKAIRGH